MELSGDESEHWCRLRVCVCVCVFASVLPVTDPFSLVNVVCDEVVSGLDCEFVEPQTILLSRKREASVAFECETKMKPESVRRGPTPQNSLFSKAVPECMRSKAPLPREGTLMQQTATWPDPPKDPPAEVEEMEVEEDANFPWNARERRLIAKMERYFENRTVKRSRESARWSTS